MREFALSAVFRPDRLRAAFSPSSDQARTIFLDALDRHVSDGTILVRWAGGEARVGRARGARLAIDVELVVEDEQFFAHVLSRGNLGMGESFMDGGFHVREGKLPEFLTLLLRNRLRERLRGDLRLLVQIAAVRAQNALRGARKNVQHHYDIGDDLFESFLDETLTYSCGYATKWDESVAVLQEQKLDRICKKLCLSRGDTLLDIGCGFGGLLIFAAKNYGVRGTGITLSNRHCERGREQVARAGLEGRIELRLESFTSVKGRYDRIVSVGMLEHVERRDYGRYFDCIAESLAPSGLALVHAIGCGVEYNEHDPFTQKYIFPGSALPRLSEITEALERRRLPILDVENLHRHYAVTARRWLERYLANRALLDRNRYDERFQKMWEYYLSSCIAAACGGEVALYQVLLAHDFAGERPWARV